MQKVHIANRGLEQYGLRPVSVPHPFYLTGYDIQRLVPWNPFEFALASLAYPLQRTEQAVGVIHPLSIGPSLETGSSLRLSTIIRLYSGDCTILYIYLEPAQTAAMAGAGGPNSLFFFCF